MLDTSHTAGDIQDVENKGDDLDDAGSDSDSDLGPEDKDVANNSEDKQDIPSCGIYRADSQACRVPMIYLACL